MINSMQKLCHVQREPFARIEDVCLHLVDAAGDDDGLPLADVDAGDGAVVEGVAQDGELGHLRGPGHGP